MNFIIRLDIRLQSYLRWQQTKHYDQTAKQMILGQCRCKAVMMSYIKEGIKRIQNALNTETGIQVNLFYLDCL